MSADDRQVARREPEQILAEAGCTHDLPAYEPSAAWWDMAKGHIALHHAEPEPRQACAGSTVPIYGDIVPLIMPRASPDVQALIRMLTDVPDDVTPPPAAFGSDEPEPRRVEATADDVTMPGEKRKRRRQPKYAEDFASDPVDYSSWAPPSGNLRTPEADAPDRGECAPPWSRAGLLTNIEQVQDPALKRALLEEYHRETQ